MNAFVAYVDAFGHAFGTWTTFKSTRSATLTFWASFYARFNMHNYILLPFHSEPVSVQIPSTASKRFERDLGWAKNHFSRSLFFFHSKTAFWNIKSYKAKGFQLHLSTFWVKTFHKEFFDLENFIGMCNKSTVISKIKAFKWRLPWATIYNSHWSEHNILSLFNLS